MADKNPKGETEIKIDLKRIDTPPSVDRPQPIDTTSKSSIRFLTVSIGTKTKSDVLRDSTFNTFGELDIATYPQPTFSAEIEDKNAAPV